MTGDTISASDGSAVVTGFVSGDVTVGSSPDDIAMALVAQGIVGGIPLAVARQIAAAFGEKADTADPDAIAEMLKRKARDYARLVEEMRDAAIPQPEVTPHPLPPLSPEGPRNSSLFARLIAFLRKILGLEESIARYRLPRQMRDVAHRIGPTPAEQSRALRLHASQLLEEGDLEAADAALLAAERVAVEDRVAALTGRAGIAMLRFDYRAAATLYAQAAAIDPLLQGRARHLYKEFEALYTLGRDFGDRAALEDAVQRAGAMAEAFPRETQPIVWAKAEANRATALHVLATREPGTERLEACIDAYALALEVRTRERNPIDWAGTANNRAVALTDLGERTRDPGPLYDAINAFREVLEEWTRERVPADWAQAQNNLGNAHSMIATWTNDAQHFGLAIEAYQAALEVWTLETAPLPRAMALNNMGNAVFRLALPDSGTALLEAALDAYREALETRTVDRVPMDHATTRLNLGHVLTELGNRTGEDAHFAEGIGHYDAAIALFDGRDSVQHEYAVRSRDMAVRDRLAATGEESP